MGRLDDPQTGDRLLLWAADYITVLLLTAGSALAFLSGYNVETDYGAVLYFCVFAALVSTMLHSPARPWWSLGAAAGIALPFWPAWESVSLVLAWLGRKMGVIPLIPGWNDALPESGALPVLLLLCAALAWIMGWIAVRVRQWYLAALLSFTLVLPAIQMGVLPMWGAILAALAGWGSMLLTALYGRRDPGGLARARLFSLTGMGALLLILVMALPMEGYSRPDWATDMRTSMIQGVTRRLERFFDPEELNGGILADLGLDLSLPEETDGGTGGGGGVSASEAFGGGQSRRENLLHLGPRRYQYRQVMEVETDEPDPAGRIYLLGGTLNVYTGESWEDAETITGDSGLTPLELAFFPALTVPETDWHTYTMTIRYSNLGGAWYYPYRFAGGAVMDESGRISGISRQITEEDVNELNPLPNRSREYQMPYLPGGPEDLYVALPEEWGEALYRNSGEFADVYLNVPDTAWQALEPLLHREMQAAANDNLTLEDLGGMVELTEEMDFWARYEASIAAASRTAALLREWAVYDLNTPAMEPGEDFLEHFIAEGRGYCVHFATAGAMLLRMQGIPARYAVGYVAELNSRGYARVLDSGAHAWVEIYLDGYGWYPMEMTPGYAGGESGVELSSEPTVALPDQTPEPEEDPEDEIPDAAAPADQMEEDQSGGEPEEDGSAIQIPWRALGRIALVLAAAGGLYGLGLLVRRRARTDPDANRSAIAAYRRYSFVLRLGGAADEAMEELGRKAKFSQHTLTEEERETVWQCLAQAVETAKRRQKKWKRWLLSLLRPLL